MATALELQSKYVGKQAHYAPERSGGMRFAVRIVDAKESYGTTRLAIEPVSGKGQKWVNVDNLESIGTVKAS